MTPTDTFSNACRSGGFDLVHAFDRAWLEDLDLSRHPLGRARGQLGFLVAHTRSLWPRFIDQRPHDEHPLDAHCERIVTEAAAQLPRDAACFFSHHIPPFPIQRLAQAAGLADLSPSHLSVHATHGPWLGLRAVVFVDLPYLGPERTASTPCGGCAQPCMPPLQAAVKKGAHAGWRDWLAVRDACPVGRASRYGEHQLRYHYTKDPQWLRPEGKSNGKT